MSRKKGNPLRKLARSIEYQNLFIMAKEMSGIQLFENIRDFSKIQLDFLFWLSLYNRFYQELAIGDNKYLTKEIIDNDLYCECYLIWERKRKPHLKDKDKKGKYNKRQINTTSTIPSIVFTKGRKK